MPPFLRFKPLNQERVWGGRALETVLGRTLPPGRPIGESWEIVERTVFLEQNVLLAKNLTLFF